MKYVYTLLLAVSIVAGRAQSSIMPAPNTDPLSDIDRWSLSGVLRQPDQAPFLTLREKPNELRLGEISFSGIAVEALKADNPLQLFNPWAPPEYGESQDNATFSLITGQVTGWKFFAFEF